MTNLPHSVQKAADYADALESKMGQAAASEPTESAGSESPEAAPPVDDEVAKLRSKYSTLQGKYNAEVPALHSRNKELESRLQQLAEENQNLRSEIESQTAETAYLTEQDEEAYGSDMVDMVRRGAKEESAKYAKQASELRNRLDEMERRFQQSEADIEMQRKQSFLTTLSELVPDWESQNTDPGFLAWLDEVDPFFGVPRKAALQRVYQALDAYGVARVFLAYRENRRPANDLARQVSPTHSRGTGSTPGAGSQKTFSQAEIAAFYDAWRRGQISDEEAGRIEKEINDAVASGRVLP